MALQDIVDEIQGMIDQLDRALNQGELTDEEYDRLLEKKHQQIHEDITNTKAQLQADRQIQGNL